MCVYVCVCVCMCVCGVLGCSGGSWAGYISCTFIGINHSGWLLGVRKNVAVAHIPLEVLNGNNHDGYHSRLNTVHRRTRFLREQGVGFFVIPGVFLQGNNVLI